MTEPGQSPAPAPVAGTEGIGLGSGPVDQGDDLDALERLISPSDLRRVGRFRFLLEGRRWEWSDAVARMHGYEPGAVTPTTKLLLEHKHPEDRGHVAAVLDRVLQGEPFSSRHRIIDTAGRTHWVVVVGDRVVDDRGAVIGTSGFYVDITQTLQGEVSSAVSRLAESRAEIEQAKGVLMATYGINADRAFEILVWRSQETNVKLRELAGRFMAAVSRAHLSPESRAHVDHALLTLQ